jgi:drug/metabolite transporter (DMT)-like permease
MRMGGSDRDPIKGGYKGIFLILLATLCIVLMNACAKMSSAVYSPVEMIFFILGGVILSAPYAMTHRRLPEGRLLAWIIGIGVFTVIQQSAKTAAYRHAEASFLAPHTYTSMLWATLVGWLLWQEMVTVPVMLGTGMVVSSDLFILRRAGTSDPGSVSHAPKSPC